MVLLLGQSVGTLLQATVCVCVRVPTCTYNVYFCLFCSSHYCCVCVFVQVFGVSVGVRFVFTRHERAATEWGKNEDMLLCSEGTEH